MNCLEAEDLGDMVEAGLLVISSPLVRKKEGLFKGGCGSGSQ